MMTTDMTTRPPLTDIIQSAGNESRGAFEAPQEKKDQYDPTGHFFQRPSSSLRQHNDSDLHAAWGNSRPHGRHDNEGEQTKRAALENKEHSRRGELAEQLLLNQASQANGYWHDNIWFDGVQPPHGGTHREREQQLQLQLTSPQGHSVGAGKPPHPAQHKWATSAPATTSRGRTHR